MDVHIVTVETTLYVNVTPSSEMCSCGPCGTTTATKVWILKQCPLEHTRYVHGNVVNVIINGTNP